MLLLVPYKRIYHGLLLSVLWLQQAIQLTSKLTGLIKLGSVSLRFTSIAKHLSAPYWGVSFATTIRVKIVCCGFSVKR